MGFAPDLMHWGVYSARPDPLAGFQGAEEGWEERGGAKEGKGMEGGKGREEIGRSSIFFIIQFYH